MITMSLQDTDSFYSISPSRRGYLCVSKHLSILSLESHFEALFSGATCGINYCIWQSLNSTKMAYSTGTFEELSGEGLIAIMWSGF